MANYIFTYKVSDRLNLQPKPRPLNVHDVQKVICFKLDLMRHTVTRLTRLRFHLSNFAILLFSTKLEFIRLYTGLLNRGLRIIDGPRNARACSNELHKLLVVALNLSNVTVVTGLRSCVMF